jgi:hypothetical protein
LNTVADVPLTTSELQRHLRERLPGYMLPSQIVLVDSLPLTSNGKIDRKALPAPDTRSGDSPSDTVPPRNPTEKVVATIWAQLLRVNHICVHDNFFDLGGHSLLATQAISRLRAAFPIHLPLSSLFEHPTPAGLAEHIDAQLWLIRSSSQSSSERTQDDRVAGEL